MPRIARNNFNTSFFHIIIQGINKEYIFKNTRYLERYLYLITKYKQKYNIEILAYCIMNNHAHLLIYTENISEMTNFMRSVNTSYARYYNELEDRVGYVFRDRYVSEPIYNENYLLKCMSYIHMNPVKASIVPTPGKYKYSSYNDYIYKKGIITNEILVLMFGSSKNYKTLFLEFHKENHKFMDYLEEKGDIQSVINTFLKNSNKKLEEIVKDNELLIKIVKELEEMAGISIRKISKILEIDRFKISRLKKK